MTAHELAQHVLAIARQGLAREHGLFVYVTDTCDARESLQQIITLCEDVPPTQDGYKQYEKKEKVSHAKSTQS